LPLLSLKKAIERDINYTVKVLAVNPAERTPLCRKVAFHAHKLDKIRARRFLYHNENIYVSRAFIERFSSGRV
jgi:hypothetical protein